jgi:high-affinity iron transporter
MFTGIVITLREGLEAFLIVGVLLAYLAKTGAAHYNKFIWAGISITAGVTLVTAFLFQKLSIQFEGTDSIIFEAAASLFAVAVLSYMVLWMQKQSRHLKADLEKKIDKAITSREVYVLVALAFTTVVREGLETVLFMGTLVKTDGMGVILSSLVGLALAASIVYILFKTSLHIDLRKFFIGTGTLLILIASGLIGHVIVSFQELGVIPVYVAEVWNINYLLDENGIAGRILHAFVGYDGNPTLLQTLAYMTYVVFFFAKYYKIIRDNTTAPRSPSTNSLPGEKLPGRMPVASRYGK